MLSALIVGYGKEVNGTNKCGELVRKDTKRSEVGYHSGAYFR